jgi:hypothetical protein
MIIILRLEWTDTMNNITYSQMNIAQAIFCVNETCIKYNERK